MTMTKSYLLTVLLAAFFAKAGFSQAPVNVRGDLIQIYTAEPNGPVYPNGEKSGSDDFFPGSIPSIIDGKEFATSVPEPGTGPKEFSGTAGRYVIAAVHSKDIVTSAWIDLNQSFTMSSGSSPRNTYHLFRRNINTTGAWYIVPQPTVNDAPTLLFADQGDIKWSDFTPLDGNFIAQKAPSATLIADPAICVLPNGNLMALAWGPSPKRQFRSADGGQTWEGYGPDNLTIRFATPFTHNGALYMLSSFRPGSDPGIFIRKSLDNGETWETYSGNDYVLLTSNVGNGALNCPSPVIVSNGRIWRAIGDAGPDDQPNLGFMSASVNADLMNPSSWTFTNTIARGSADGRYGGILKPWEPCAVVNKDGGYPLMLARTNPQDARNGDSSPLYRATSPTNLTFDESDVVDFLGAKDKFCVRYDPASDKYWALANTAAAAEYGGGETIWSRRSRLVLQSSDDLDEWQIEYIVAQAPDSRFSGYQYPYFVFDGDDIIAAVRTAAEYEDGMAKRAHDANFLTFNRIENFRQYLTKPKAVTLRRGWEQVYASAQGAGEGDAPGFQGLSGDNEWEQINLNNGYYAYRKLGTELALQANGSGNEVTLEPYRSANQSQQWRKVKADFRHFRLESRSSGGYFIDGGGVTLSLQAQNTSDTDQNWEIEPTRTELSGGSSCSIVPYINVNQTGWKNIDSVSVDLGDEVWFGPQSAEFGATTSVWSYTGPGGITYAERAWVIEDIQANQAGTYTVTNTDQNGCTSSLDFTVSVSGGALSGSYSFKNVSTGQVLGSAPNGALVLGSEGSSPDKQWNLITTTEGYVMLDNGQTDRGPIAAKPSPGNLLTWKAESFNATPYANREWMPVPVSGNVYKFQCRDAGRGYIAASASGPINQLDGNATTAHWELISTTAARQAAASKPGTKKVDELNTDSGMGSLQVYPNPAEGSFNVHLEGTDQARIYLYNSEGRLILEQSYTGGVLPVSTTTRMQPGMYLLRAVSEGGIVNSTKLLMK